MSAAVETAAPAETLATFTTSDQIRVVINIIRGDLAAGFLHIGGKSLHGFDSVEIAVGVGDAINPLPRPLSTAVLNDYALHVDVAIRRDRGRTSPLSSIAALPITWPIGATRSLPVRPDAGAIEVARQRLDALGLAASVLVLGGRPEAGDGFTATALLPLDQPLDLTEPDAERGILDRQRRLAAKLEAEPPVDLAGLVVPCPGAIVRVSGARQRAAVIALHPSATVSVADLDRVLDGTSTSSTSKLRSKK